MVELGVGLGQLADCVLSLLNLTLLLVAFFLQLQILVVLLFHLGGYSVVFLAQIVNLDQQFAARGRQ